MYILRLLSYTQKQYKCFHPPTKKFFVIMDVKFFEDISYYPKTNLQGEKTRVEDLSYSLCQPSSVIYPVINDLILLKSDRPSSNSSSQP